MSEYLEPEIINIIILIIFVDNVCDRLAIPVICFIYFLLIVS